MRILCGIRSGSKGVLQGTLLRILFVILYGFYMDSWGSAIEFRRDSKGMDRNEDGHFHLRKDVDGEMGWPPAP